MKRIFKIITVITVMLFICSALTFSAFATEVQSVDETTTASVEEVTFFGRIWEWIVENHSEIIEKLLYGASIIFGTVLYKWNTKNSNTLNSNVLKLADATVASSNDSKAYISAINTAGENIKELYSLCDDRFKMLSDELKKDSTELIEELKQDSRVLVDVMAEVMTILEILMSVYPQSKNLPQGVKDIITLKYAKCQELVGNDERMNSVLQMIHNIINEKSSATVEAVS